MKGGMQAPRALHPVQATLLTPISLQNSFVKPAFAVSLYSGYGADVFKVDDNKVVKNTKYNEVDYFDKTHFTDTFLKEVAIMESLNDCSPMISPTIYAYDTSNTEEHSILMEYLENQEITDTKLFSKNAFKALDILHERGYAHCDIHARNFVVTIDNGFKFLDFGCGSNATSTTRIFPTMGHEFEIPKFIKDMADWVVEATQIKFIYSSIRDLEILKFCDILCLMHEIFRIDPDIFRDFEKKLVDCESFEDFVSLYNNFRSMIDLVDYNGFEGFNFTIPNLCVDQLLFKNAIKGVFPGSREVVLPALIQQLFTKEQQEKIQADLNILISTEYVEYLRHKNGTVIIIMNKFPLEVNMF
tara:strand:+ start:1303 stop:2373 length:1071 start_codon:yes stop_codon:yes gene_type:complete